MFSFLHQWITWILHNVTQHFRFDLAQFQDTYRSLNSYNVHLHHTNSWYQNVLPGSNETALHCSLFSNSEKMDVAKKKCSVLVQSTSWTFIIFSPVFTPTPVPCDGYCDLEPLPHRVKADLRLEKGLIRLTFDGFLSPSCIFTHFFSLKRLAEA